MLPLIIGQRIVLLQWFWYRSKALANSFRMVAKRTQLVHPLKSYGRKNITAVPYVRYGTMEC